MFYQWPMCGHCVAHACFTSGLCVADAWPLPKAEYGYQDDFDMLFVSLCCVSSHTDQNYCKLCLAFRLLPPLAHTIRPQNQTWKAVRLKELQNLDGARVHTTEGVALRVRFLQVRLLAGIFGATGT